MYQQLNSKLFYVLTALYVYVFGMNPITNSGYLSIVNHELIGFLIAEPECVYCVVPTDSL